MSKTRFIIIVAVLVFNLAALLLLAWVGFRKQAVANRSNVISIELGKSNLEKGIRLREWAKDGATEAVDIGGAECRVVQGRPPGGRAYMYFAIDSSFKQGGLMDVLVTVEYFDHAPGEFRLNYDAVDLAANRRQYLSAEERQKCLGSQQWRKAYFIARNARFQNSQNAASDFRLELRIPELYVRRVTIQPLNGQSPRSSTQ
jgi:hypothetical protein